MFFPRLVRLGANVVVFGLLIFSARAESLKIGGGKIDVEFLPNDADFPRELAMNWIATAARAVSSYYGRLPVAQLVVRVRENDGDEIGGGETCGRPDGGLIKIEVGRATTADDFHSDWMMTHEMVHLAFPSVEERSHWIEEGLATYVEPIARVQIGNLHARQVWSDLVRDLSQGLPGPGDRGLDFTPTWGRTYWGGALFCLLADVEIRRRTNNAKGLVDALRGILSAGGSIREDWNLERALRAGDHAVGVMVLEELYAKMRAAPYPVNLPDLWHQLGIEPHDRSVSLRDDAPLAVIRKAILPE